VLDFSRKTVTQKTALELTSFLKEMVKMLKRIMPEMKIDLQIKAQDLFVVANLVQLQQVITNLAVNARDAMPTGGTLFILLDRIKIKTNPKPLPDLKPGNWVLWAIRDTGTGMSPEVLKHIFEPFFTTKEPGKGTGLGLSQVFGIIKQHGGEITVESQKDRGTHFNIYLPETQRPVSCSKPIHTQLQKGQGETVLIVEDDMGVMRLTRKYLEILNYQVIHARNGQEALALIDTHKDNIHLILSDMVMPETDGLTLVKKLRDKGHHMPVMMMSGYPNRWI
jgi:CheY-like chemotaxis protein